LGSRLFLLDAGDDLLDCVARVDLLCESNSTCELQQLGFEHEGILTDVVPADVVVVTPVFEGVVFADQVNQRFGHAQKVEHEIGHDFERGWGGWLQLFQSILH